MKRLLRTQLNTFNRNILISKRPANVTAIISSAKRQCQGKMHCIYELLNNFPVFGNQQIYLGISYKTFMVSF